jgi:hypothetical protein
MRIGIILAAIFASLLFAQGAQAYMHADEPTARARGYCGTAGAAGPATAPTTTTFTCTAC